MFKVVRKNWRTEGHRLGIWVNEDEADCKRILYRYSIVEAKSLTYTPSLPMLSSNNSQGLREIGDIILAGGIEEASPKSTSILWYQDKHISWGCSCDAQD